MVASESISLHCSTSRRFAEEEYDRALEPHSDSQKGAASFLFPFSSIFILRSSPVDQKERARSIWEKSVSGLIRRWE